MPINNGMLLGMIKQLDKRIKELEDKNKRLEERLEEFKENYPEQVRVPD